MTSFLRQALFIVSDTQRVNNPHLHEAAQTIRHIKSKGSNKPKDTLDFPEVITNVGKAIAKTGVIHSAISSLGFPLACCTALYAITSFAGYQFRLTRSLKRILEQIEHANVTLQAKIDSLQKHIDTLGEENKKFKMENIKLSGLVKDISAETKKLSDLRRNNAALFEKNETLHKEMLKTANQLNVVKELLCEEVTKLKNSSTSIRGGVKDLNGEVRKLQHQREALVSDIKAIMGTKPKSANKKANK